MTRLLALLLYAACVVIGWLPWTLLHALGDMVGWAWRVGNARESVVAKRNLAIAYPDITPAERVAMHHAVLRATGRQAFETLRFWTRSHAGNLALLAERHGEALFDDAIASGNGVIVAAPHYGNWELLNQWLASRTALTILYKPPESAIGEAFLQHVRADGDRVMQVRAEGAGIRKLFKLLKAGGVVGILPDQQPKGGDGEFAPFFERPALTMTLINRLAERSGPAVLFCYCERIAGGPQFALHVTRASDLLANADPHVGVAALNLGVEDIARRDPSQYQWTYKRWSRRPPGSTEENPYRDGEIQR